MSRARKGLSEFGDHGDANNSEWGWDSWEPEFWSESPSEVALQRPVILTRSDGQPLLYARRTHDLHGASEAGKSWVALIAAAEMMRAGGNLLFLDYEDAGKYEVGARLRMLGVPVPRIKESLFYVQPMVPPIGDSFSRLASENVFGLVIIDAVQGALAELERGANSGDDVVVFAKALPIPLATWTQAPVLQIDHLPHITPKGRVGPTGSPAKRATLTGASYRVQVRAPIQKRAVGVLELWVVKDRPGSVREVSGPRAADGSQLSAVITFDATDPDAIVVSVDPPPVIGGPPATVEDRQEQVDAELKERLSKAAEGALPGSLNASDLAVAAGGDRNTMLALMKDLVRDGYLSMALGRRGAHMHHSERPYRVADAHTANTETGS